MGFTVAGVCLRLRLGLRVESHIEPHTPVIHAARPHPHPIRARGPRHQHDHALTTQHMCVRLFPPSLPHHTFIDQIPNALRAD